MSIWEDQLLPRFIALALGVEDVSVERRKTLSAVRGTVLEIGFGAGLNVPLYPNEVERVIGIDPSVVSATLARKRIEKAAFPVEYRAIAGEEIDVETASVDTAVSTFTLCTIPDPIVALHQVRRALKPGGRFHFLEHGRSPVEKERRWQERWNPAQKKLFGGCHVNRPIDALVREAGFTIESLDNFYLQGPKFLSYMYRGIATS